VYKSPQEVDILTKRMKALGMLFNEESDVAGYLGVLLDRDPINDTITLRQSGLSQRIVEALHLDDDTPTAKTPADAYLPIDEDGERAHELYNFASVAGMLQYLQGHLILTFHLPSLKYQDTPLVQNALMNLLLNELDDISKEQ
jgi:hypothetical protein